MTYHGSVVNVKHLLGRLLEIVGDSNDYFVSGSLSFLPLLGNYRQPAHDVDAALAQELFHIRRKFLAPNEHIRFLSLSELAIAANSSIARLVAPRTGFIHINGPDGLLDLSCYRTCDRSVSFSLGAGLRLVVPRSIIERFRFLTWEGMSYQAGPPELAFIPKAVWYLETESKAVAINSADLKHLEDLKRLVKIIDWDFVNQLLEQGGLHWLGFPLRRLDPFKTAKILSLQQRLTGP